MRIRFAAVLKGTIMSWSKSFPRRKEVLKRRRKGKFINSRLGETTRTKPSHSVVFFFSKIVRFHQTMVKGFNVYICMRQGWLKKGNKRRFINVRWGVAKFIKSQPKLNKVTHEMAFFFQVSTYGFTFLWETLQYSACCGWLDLTMYISVWWRVATALSCTYHIKCLKLKIILKQKRNICICIYFICINFV